MMLKIVENMHLGVHIDMYLEGVSDSDKVGRMGILIAKFISVCDSVYVGESHRLIHKLTMYWQVYG